MTRKEYKERLAESIANVMAATLMDSSNQGDQLQSAAERFAAEIMDEWLWHQMVQDTSAAMDRVENDTKKDMKAQYGV